MVTLVGRGAHPTDCSLKGGVKWHDMWSSWSRAPIHHLQKHSQASISLPKYEDNPSLLIIMWAVSVLLFKLGHGRAG